MPSTATRQRVRIIVDQSSGEDKSTENVLSFQIDEMRIGRRRPCKLDLWMRVNDRRALLCDRAQVATCLKETVFHLDIRCTVYFQSPDVPRLTILLCQSKQILGQAVIANEKQSVGLVGPAGNCIGSLSVKSFMISETKQSSLYGCSSLSPSRSSLSLRRLSGSDLIRRRIQRLMKMMQIDVKKKQKVQDTNVLSLSSCSLSSLPERRPMAHSQTNASDSSPCKMCVLVDAGFVSRCDGNGDLQVWHQLAKSVNIVDPNYFPSELCLPKEGLLLLIGTDALVNACLRCLIVQMSLKPAMTDQLQILYAPTNGQQSALAQLLSAYFGSVYKNRFLNSPWVDYCQNGESEQICNFLLHEQGQESRRSLNSVDLRIAQVVLSRGIESKLIPFLAQAVIRSEKASMRLHLWYGRSSVENGAAASGEEIGGRRRIRCMSVICTIFGSGNGSGIDLCVHVESKGQLLQIKQVQKLVCSPLKHKRISATIDSVPFADLKFVQISPSWHTHIDRFRFCC